MKTSNSPFPISSGLVNNHTQPPQQSNSSDTALTQTIKSISFKILSKISESGSSTVSSQGIANLIGMLTSGLDDGTDHGLQRVSNFLNTTVTRSELNQLYESLTNTPAVKYQNLSVQNFCVSEFLNPSEHAQQIM